MLSSSVVDAHQHFWQLDRADYGWLTEDLTALYKDFLPDDLRIHLTETGVEKPILVQAAPTLEETYYLIQIAEKTDYVAGVVGWLDMESQAATGIIESLGKHSLFLGIRPMLQDIPDPEWMLKPELQTIYDKLNKSS